MIEAVIDNNQNVLGYGSDEHEAKLDLQVSPAFRPASATFGRSHSDSLDYFLGLLNLDAQGWREWSRRLRRELDEAASEFEEKLKGAEEAGSEVESRVAREQEAAGAKTSGVIRGESPDFDSSSPSDSISHSEADNQDEDSRE